MKNKIPFLLLLFSIFLLACRVADWLAAGTPYPTPSAHPPAPNTSAPAPTAAPGNSQPNASPTFTALPTNPPSGNLQPAPTLLAPPAQATFAALTRVQFQWTWNRPLAPNEYFDVQIAKDNPANMASIGCTRGPNFDYTLPGVGTYFWRVVVKNGAATPPVCSAQSDVSQPSEARVLVASPAQAQPTATQLQPSATPQSSPTSPPPTQPQPTATRAQPTTPAPTRYP